MTDDTDQDGQRLLFVNTLRAALGVRLDSRGPGDVERIPVTRPADRLALMGMLHTAESPDDRRYWPGIFDQARPLACDRLASWADLTETVLRLLAGEQAGRALAISLLFLADRLGDSRLAWFGVLLVKDRDAVEQDLLQYLHTSLEQMEAGRGLYVPEATSAAAAELRAGRALSDEHLIAMAEVYGARFSFDPSDFDPSDGHRRRRPRTAPLPEELAPDMAAMLDRPSDAAWVLFQRQLERQCVHVQWLSEVPRDLARESLEERRVLVGRFYRLAVRALRLCQARLAGIPTGSEQHWLQLALTADCGSLAPLVEAAANADTAPRPGLALLAILGGRFAARREVCCALRAAPLVAIGGPVGAAAAVLAERMELPELEPLLELASALEGHSLIPPAPAGSISASVTELGRARDEDPVYFAELTAPGGHAASVLGEEVAAVLRGRRPTDPAALADAQSTETADEPVADGERMRQAGRIGQVTPARSVHVPDLDEETAPMSSAELLAIEHHRFGEELRWLARHVVEAEGEWLVPAELDWPKTASRLHIHDRAAKDRRRRLVCLLVELSRGAIEAVSNRGAATTVRYLAG